MFTFLFLIYEFFTALPYAVIVAGIIGLFLLWFVTKWARHMSGIQNPLARELSQASHGAALIFLAPLLTHIAVLNRWIYLLPHDWLLFVWPITLALMALGAFWLIVCAARTRTNFRDAQLIARAVIKIAIGCVALWTLYQNILPPWSWPYRHELSLAIFFVALFCVITGLVKFVLLLRGPPGASQWRAPTDLPDAGFGSGEGFR
jgi:hypothetical protein